MGEGLKRSFGEISERKTPEVAHCVGKAGGRRCKEERKCEGEFLSHNIDMLARRPLFLLGGAHMAGCQCGEPKEANLYVKWQWARITRESKCKRKYQVH